MHCFEKIILETFATALHQNEGQPRPTEGLLQEFNKAIRFIGNMTDFYLIAQYDSHIDSTISYMQPYLYEFHETKDIFSRFRGDKKSEAGGSKSIQESVKRTQPTKIGEGPVCIAKG